MNRLFIVPLILWSCTFTSNVNNNRSTLDEQKAEIVRIEKSLMKWLIEKGLAEAFAHYADEEGVIKRDTLYKGKDAIFSFYDKTSQEGVNLTWTPEFVDISESGDMAYTYGLYTYTFPDSLGNTSSTTGIFHTIWKRQADGTWRFVWD